MNHATNEPSFFFLTHTKEYHQSGSVQLREVVLENGKDQHHSIDNYDMRRIIIQKFLHGFPANEKLTFMNKPGREDILHGHKL